jgi:hypothetical protein
MKAKTNIGTTHTTAIKISFKKPKTFNCLKLIQQDEFSP